jgi:phage shock protein A
MFDNLRQAFREAVDNFKEELNRDDVPDVVDGLLRQMQEEVVDTKAHIRTLEEQIEKAVRMAEVEGKEVATCRRREGMARKIGDDETARLAAEYAEKHERRREIQEGKVRALREELEMKRQEVEEMMVQLKEARARRESLTATLGRASARDSMTGADDLFSEMDRLAEEIEGADRQREAEEDLLADLEGPGERGRRSEPSPEETAEDRLRELKRRMGEES